MITFAHDGNSIFSGVWKTITSARGFDESLLSIPRDATHWVRYTTGSVADLINGEGITGDQAGDTAVVVDFVIEQGAFGTTNTEGVLFLKSLAQTFTSTTLTGDTSTGTVAVVAANILSLQLRKGQPKAALITVETADLIFTMSGLLPTATAGTNYGFTLTEGQNTTIRGIDNLRNFKCINAVNASGVVVKYELFF